MVPQAIYLAGKRNEYIYIDKTGFQLKDFSNRYWSPRSRKLIFRYLKKSSNFSLMRAIDNRLYGLEMGDQQEQFMGLLAALTKYLQKRGDLKNQIHSAALLREITLHHVPHPVLSPYSPTAFEISRAMIS